MIFFWIRRTCFGNRSPWLQGGDRNTKFFHISTLLRRRRNKIERLKTSDGIWVNDKEAINNLAVEYFTFFLSLILIPWLWIYLDYFLSLSLLIWGRNVSEEEIKDALFSIGPLKAPGPDGYPATFFHNCWNSCKEDIIKLVLSCFSSGDSQWHNYCLGSQSSQSNVHADLLACVILFTKWFLKKLLAD